MPKEMQYVDTFAEGCVMCGESVPEGRLVCHACEVRVVSKNKIPDEKKEIALKSQSMGGGRP